jgi:hypothetical protein
MFVKTIAWILPALFCLGAGIAQSQESASPAKTDSQAGKTVTVTETAVPEISEQQFELERQAMIDDLTEKLTVLGEARDCAEAAKAPAALRQCADAFRQAILKKRPAP